jgi:hypothetical protein
LTSSVDIFGWSENDECFGVMDSRCSGGVDLEANEIKMQVIDESKLGFVNAK